MLLAQALASCGGSNDHPAAARVWKSTAARRGVVAGFVIDDETGAPVANAMVTVAGVATRAHTDGTFTVPAPAGRAHVLVGGGDLLETTRDVAVGEQPLPIAFRVAHRATPQMVTSAGGTFQFREAQLSVPAGAFPQSTAVALTFLARARVAAIAGSPQFVDDDQIPRRVVASVHFDSEQPPAMAVRVRVPVPVDATMDNLIGFAIGADGQWSNKVKASGVNAGFADFDLSGNTRFGVAVDVRTADARRVAYLVTESGDSAMLPGEVLMGGTELTVAHRALAVVDPQGSRLEIAPASRMRLAAPTMDPPPSDMNARRVAQYAGQGELVAGRARVLVPTTQPGKEPLVKLTLFGRAAHFNVHGTAFTVSTCESPGGGSVDTIEVGEGTVSADFGGKSSSVLAGESATFCTKCAEGQAPQCGAGDDGGASADDASAMTLDASAKETSSTALDAGSDLSAPSPDGAIAADASPLPPDGAIALADAPPPPIDTVQTMPDAALPPPVDAAVPPPADAAPPPADTALPPPVDAAMAEPDAMAPPPDASVLPPDAAATPDAATTTPDMEPATPDMAAAMPDAMAPPPDASLASLVGSPNNHSFGTVPVGSTGKMPAVFTVQNQGGSPSGTPTVQISAEFIVESTDCDTPIAAGDYCTVTVNFMPTSQGTKTGALMVTASPGGTTGASLSGSGANPAMVVLMPQSKDFGTLLVGNGSSEALFMVKNAGDLPASVTATSIGGTSAADFAVSSNTCSTAPLQGGQMCGIGVVFKPKTPGGKTAALTVSSDAGGNASASLVGYAMSGTNVQITPASYDFGNVPVRTDSATVTFTVKNAGDVQSSGVYANITGTNANDFIAVNNSCTGGTLAPGQSCLISVRFTPGGTGARTASLQALGSTGGPIATAAPLIGNGTP